MKKSIFMGLNLGSIIVTTLMIITSLNIELVFAQTKKIQALPNLVQERILIFLDGTQTVQTKMLQTSNIV
ncbi:MAG: hypothetical protein WBL68_02500 [Nitrososphaeraceae archaeon]